MTKKGRRLLTRIGAGLMLGMSLLNFGAVWSRQQGGRMPRKARNIRKTQTEQSDVDILEIAQVAEQEAGIVMAEEQLRQREDVQLATESSQSSWTDGVARHVAIFVWVFSATALFASAVFNFPFSLGKGALAFFPGNPHVGKIVLQTNEQNVELGKSVVLSVVAFPSGESVSDIRISAEFNPANFSFEGYEVVEESGLVVSQREIDEQKGKVEILFSQKNDQGFSDQGKIADLKFKSLTSGFWEVSLNEKSSLMMSLEKRENILGKVKGIKLKIFE